MNEKRNVARGSAGEASPATPPADDERFYGCAIRRIYRLAVILGAAGSLLALIWKGWPAGVGFFAGAAASTLSFRWFHQLVESLGPDAAARPRARMAWLLGLRYLFFGLGGYVIVKFFGVNAIAALAGLFAVAAAVMIEIIYQLIYART